MTEADESAFVAEIIRRIPGAMPVLKANIGKQLGINPPRPYQIRDPAAAGGQEPFTAERGQPRNQE